MNIVIPIKLVPDLVEELAVDESGTALDMAWLSLILSEFDDHAIEQGILLKEHSGGQVTIIAPEVEGADEALFTAAAKGAAAAATLSAGGASTAAGSGTTATGASVSEASAI